MFGDERFKRYGCSEPGYYFRKGTVVQQDFEKVSKHPPLTTKGGTSQTRTIRARTRLQAHIKPFRSTIPPQYNRAPPMSSSYLSPRLVHAHIMLWKTRLQITFSTL
ncbi:hypothetical protein EMCRGX_G009980 [Ephydatia muelleri]